MKVQEELLKALKDCMGEMSSAASVFEYDRSWMAVISRAEAALDKAEESNFDPLKTEEMVLDEAREAFFDVLKRHYPASTVANRDPLDDYDFSQACREALSSWCKAHQVARHLDKTALWILESSPYDGETILESDIFCVRDSNNDKLLSLVIKFDGVDRELPVVFKNRQHLESLKPAIVAYFAQRQAEQKRVNQSRARAMVAV